MSNRLAFNLGFLALTAATVYLACIHSDAGFGTGMLVAGMIAAYCTGGAPDA